MLKVISHSFLIIILLNIMAGVSHATSIGIDMSGFLMPEVHISSNDGYTEAFSNRPWGESSATASTTGHLTARSANVGLSTYDVNSKSWIDTTILNSSTFSNIYFLDLDYMFDLNPGFWEGQPFEGGVTDGNIDIFINNQLLSNVSYHSEITWNEEISPSGGVYYSPVINGPTHVTASQDILLGELKPGESLDLKYSISTSSWAYEYYQSNAFGELNASVYTSANPVPEPSSFMLVAAGLAVFAINRRKMKMQN